MYITRFTVLGLLIMGLVACRSSSESGSFNQTTMGDGGIKITQLEDNKTQIGEIVYFGVDKSIVSSDMMKILDAQISFLKENGRQSITIEGHTDEQGTREYNLGLGAKRANAVKHI